MSSVKLPWKLYFLISLHRFITNACSLSNGTVNRCLANLFDLKASASKTPRDGVTTSDTIINASTSLWFRLYTPQSGDDDMNTSLPMIIYFHGGGFVFFSANSITYDNFCRRLARELRAVVVSVNYRLAPEHKFPCQYEDCFEALKYLDRNFDKLSVDANPEWCFLAGDSAGGNLAHHVAVRAGEYELCKLKLIGLIAIQPFFGGEERTEAETSPEMDPILTVDLTDRFWEAFLPDGSDRDHPAANVFGPKSTLDLSQVRFPETLIFIGGFDLLKDWQRRYYEGLKKAGKEVNLVEFPNSFHGSLTLKELNESCLLIKEIKDFIQKQTNKN